MRFVLTTASEDQTIALGEALGRALLPGDLLALHGDLGAGKTRLVRGIARGAGADPARVSSPTFVIMQEYPCACDAPIRTLVHVDAYRLHSPDELETIGWDRIARELETRRPVAAVIEWAERIDAALPRDNGRLDIRLEHADAEGSRRVTIEGDDAWRARPAWSGVERQPPSRPPTRCPITGKPVPPDSPTYPFFDERARLADLGRWMSGSYTVSRDLLPDEEIGPDGGGG
jgi:tRNA threonylcarbamoyl adenosine modification protein YjeE